jgi:hypothetical protein
MKLHYSITLIICFICASGLNSQLGIKAGISASDITFLDEGQKPYLGYEIYPLIHKAPLITFQVGAFRPIPLNDRFSFQPEILFIRQGLDYSTSYLYDDISYKIKIHYLRLPLLFKYHTAIKKEKQSGIFAGPYFSAKLNATKRMEVEGVRQEEEKENVRNTDIGVIVGYTTDIGFPFGHLLLNIQSSYSIVNMMDQLEGSIPWYLGPNKAYARNISITISIGYQFSQLSKTRS